MKQYTGVFGIKHIIKWLFPRAVAAFESCSKIHDEQYKHVDWSLGDKATLAIDWEWRICAGHAAGDDDELRRQGEFFYQVAREWGVRRARLWAKGFRWGL